MEQITIDQIENLGSDSLEVFGGMFEGGINLQQVPDEITGCINSIIKSGKIINNFLEIGAAAGGNTFLFNHVFYLKEIVIIDDNKHKKHGLRDENLDKIIGKIYEFIGDSKTKKAVDFVKNLKMKFDIIFIDGDHTFNGVESDIENYSGFLADGGFLVLHDTVSCEGVKKAFKSQKGSGKYSCTEFISKTDKKCGIGLLQKKSDKKVSIIIPVIRPESSEKCVESIIKNAGIPTWQYEILTLDDSKELGCPKMVEILTAKAEHDLVMFLGDDTIPEKDFLKNALDAMKTLPDGWGVVGLNTQDINRPNGNPLAHWMAHKNMLEHIPGGNFFSIEYEHCWGDNELRDIAEDMGRWAYAEKSMITHVHPVNKTAPYDEGYQKAYDKGKTDRDFKTYCRRKRDRMKARYGIKLAIAVPLTDEQVYRQFFFSFVKVVTEYMSSLVKNGKPISFDVLMPDFPCQVDAARNNLVQQALLLGCTHILMMDTDQIYMTENMIEKMLAHDKPVVGARVHRRYPPFDPLLLRGEPGKLYQVPDEEIRNEDGTFYTEVPVTYTGTGCILYDMQIFNDMIPAKWFRFSVGDQGQPIGEDINFCDELKKAGIPIVVDCSIDIKHLTLLATDYGTYKLFQKIMK